MTLTQTKYPYYNSNTKTLHINTVKDNKLINKVFPEYEKIMMDIFLSAITEKECEEITEYLKKETPKEEKEKIKAKFSHIDLDNILAYGDGNTSSVSLGEIFQKYYPSEHSFSANIRYRNYEKPYEEWMANKHVNMCEEKKTCYESALRKLGAKGVHGMTNEKIPFYTILWCAKHINLETFKLYYGL